VKRVLLAGVGLFAAMLLLGCGSESSSDGVFDEDAYPFTFEYPDDWTESDDVEISEELGGAGLDKRAVAIDESDGIIVERFELNVEVDEKNIDLAQDELDGLITSIDPSATGEVGDIGGYISVTYDDVQVPEPESVSRLVVLFDGDQEYLLNCQYTEDHTDEVIEGCDQAIDTLEPK